MNHSCHFRTTLLSLEASIARYASLMVQIMRVQGRWTGFSGGPGYTAFHFRDFTAGGEATSAQAQAAVDRANVFFNAVRTDIPDEISIQVESEVEVLEDTTGTLVDVFNTVQAAPNQGLASSVYSGPVGAVVNWSTQGIRAGRRIRGRTFLVPLEANSFTGSGGLSTTSQGRLAAAAAELADSTSTPDLGVWARPTGPGIADGQWSVVSGSRVPTLAAVLRSRRD